ncbi:ATP-binding protein [Bacteroides sp. 51]|uniref:ATP-binding protein n=1 Tax=Bacteroides sp. 51 TaxID=2302938 RepID=UPI0013D3D1BF|nr:ATP-binding protein [Bacteroides sp. 51]NDV82377.1 sensor histidine kinase [Bacteroides sp. 51]
MKKQLLTLILSVLYYTLYANPGEQAYDSIMNIMKDRSIPLLERYYMTGDIEYYTFPQQIIILKTLLPEAKEYEDKAVITRLYSVIANQNILSENLEEAKTYLDSAFLYKGKFENNAIAGLMYFTAGHYYHDLNDVRNAHENYYESAKYLQKLPSRPPLLTDIYYNLAGIYVLWGDENRLKELIEEMEEVPVYFPHQHMLNSWVIGEYYNVQYSKYNQPALLDSVIKYNLYAVDLYDQNELTHDQKHQVAQNYVSLVRAYIEKGDIEAARKSLAQVDTLTNKEKWSTLMQLNTVKGQFYAFNKEYDKAKQALNEALKQLGVLKEEQKTDFYDYYIEIYDRLGYIYEQQKRYEEALICEKKSLEYRKQIFNRENTTIVNDLRTQYNLDQQERIVNQLTLLSERRRNINILAVVVLILFLALIVQLVVRFRITKRANENKLKLEQMKRKESELQVELYKSRHEEKEREFEIMQNEAQQRRMQSYLEGLETARERLSKELHDNISNELLALKMRMLQSEKSEEIIEKLGQIQAEVRAVSHDLLPPVFQHARFTEVLYDYVFQWNELSQGGTAKSPYGTQLVLDFNPEDESWDELPEDVNLGLYRIIQESVGNALKHAEATQINITLSRETDTITLAIQDNGKGFEVQGDHHGIGLKLIKERAKGLNGQATIQSAPDKGTKIEVIIRCS